MAQKTARQRKTKEKINGRVTANGTRNQNKASDETKPRSYIYVILVLAFLGVGLYMYYPTIIAIINSSKVEAPSNVDTLKERDLKTEERPETNSKSFNDATPRRSTSQSDTKNDVKEKLKPDQQNSGQPMSSKSSSSNKKPPKPWADFNATYLKTMSPKKIFVDGRRLPPVELLPQKPNNSSVRVFLYEDFLSEQECDGLMNAHKRHIEEMSKNNPILCFDGVETLRKHLKNVNKKIKVTPQIFTPGTTCVNASFSSKLKRWLRDNWSYSTAFYPGESRFSHIFEHRVKEATALIPTNGGKFQITSYPEGIGYKTHTDCVEGSEDKRDRVATILVYLQDVEEGGETKFPELGIWAKPKKGRALVWNNMNEDGYCEPLSIHQASKVVKGHKYILQRWYYYKSFYSLGKRPSEPSLPERQAGSPRVSCDEYDHGSCRWYDEWNYDHILEYQNQKIQLI